MNLAELTAHFRRFSGQESLAVQYAKIHEAGRQAVLSGEIFHDPLARAGDHGEADGVDLIVNQEQFPDALQDRFRRMLLFIKGDEPNVVTQPEGTFHVSVLCLNPTYSDQLKGSSGPRRVYRGPSVLDLMRYDDYLIKTAGVMATTKPFKIRFGGLCVSPKALFVGGFADNDAMANLRVALATAFFEQDLSFSEAQPNIVHIAAARFTGPLMDPRAFIARCNQWHTTNLGQMLVDRVVLVREMGAYLSKYQFENTFLLGTDWVKFP
jgi:hypothetical protein